MKKGSSILPFIILIAAGIFLLNSSSGMISLIFSTLLKGAGIALLLVAILVIAVMYFAFRSNKPGTDTNTKQVSQSLSTKGRQRVVQLRSLGMNIKNRNIRNQTEEICKAVEKLLVISADDTDKTLQTDSFIENYLSTLGSVLTKFARLESNGSLTDDVTANAVSCLEKIKTATENQQKSLLENDIMDIAIEMETLIAMCKRDGLLAEEGFSFTEEGQGITLVL